MHATVLLSTYEIMYSQCYNQSKSDAFFLSAVVQYVQYMFTTATVQAIQKQIYSTAYTSISTIPLHC